MTNGKATRFGMSQKTCKTKSRNRPLEESGGCNNVELPNVSSVFMRKEKTWLLIVAYVWGGMWTGASVFAQVSVPDTIGGKVHVLNEVEVSASASRRNMMSTSPVQMLSKSQLVRQGVTDIADALRRFSGVNVKDYGGAGGMKTVSVRSLGSQHTSVSYDGMTISDCQSGQVDLSRFSLDNIQSLSLAVGDNEDIFVPARSVASAASIRLQTVMPELSERPFRVKAEVKAGSFGLVNPFVRYDQRLAEQVSMSLSGDFMRADNRYPFTLVNGKYVSEEHRNNNYIETWRGEWNLYARPTEHAVLNGKVYYYDSFRELPGPVILYNNVSDEELNERNFFSQLHYMNYWDNGFSLQLNGKFNWASSHYHDEGEEFPGGEMNNKYYQREYYGSVALLYTPHEDWSLSYAADYSFNNLTSNATLGVKPFRHTVLQTLAVRYRTSRLTATALLLGSLYLNEAKGGDPAKDARRLSPSVSVSWKPWEEQGLRIRASYKDIFRVATFTENYFGRWGTRDLNPEVARQYNVGLTFANASSRSWLEELNFSVDGYYNYVKDKIVAMPYNMFFWTMVNLGRVDIWGVDATLDGAFRFAPRHRLLSTLSYTYQKAVDKTDPSSAYYEDQIPYTPEHSGAFSVAWENPYANVAFHATGVGKRYSAVQNIASNELDGYIEYGVALYRSFKWKRVDCSLRLDVQNLGNKQYSIVKNYPMPGRSYKVTLGINI